MNTSKHSTLAGLLALLAFEAPAGAAGPQPVPIAEQGARHGQAMAAARICPGARTTPKAQALGTQLSPADRETFDRESARVVAAWTKAFSCKDVDPAQTREINGCRRAKILSCTAAWQEIGPEGVHLPGLLEFQPDAPPSQSLSTEPNR